MKIETIVLQKDGVELMPLITISRNTQYTVESDGVTIEQHESVPPASLIKRRTSTLAICVMATSVAIIVCLYAIFGTLMRSTHDVTNGLKLQVVQTALDGFSQIYKVIGENEVVLAEGIYRLNYRNNGWHHLHLIGKDLSGSDVNEYLNSMQALGYLEGFVTCTEINHFYVNFYNGLFADGDPSDESVAFLLRNYEWMKTEADTKWKSSDYWLNVKALLMQLDGMLRGLREGCPGSETGNKKSVDYLPNLKKNPSIIHLLLLNSDGDLYEIAAKYEQERAPSFVMDDQYLQADDDRYRPSTFNLTYVEDGKHESNSWNGDGNDGDGNDGDDHNGAEDEQDEDAEKSGPHGSKFSAVATAVATPTDLQKSYVAVREKKGESMRSVRGPSKRKEGYIPDFASHVKSKRESVFTAKAVHTPGEPMIARSLIGLGEHEAGDAMLMHRLESDRDEQEDVSVQPQAEAKAGVESGKGLEADVVAAAAATTAVPPKGIGIDHCSVLIKLLPDRSDLLFGHNTWDDYQLAGPRIFKQYSFSVLKYEDTAAPAAAPAAAAPVSSHPISSSSSTSSEGYRAGVSRAEVTSAAVSEADADVDAGAGAGAVPGNGAGPGASAEILSNIGGASLRRPAFDYFETTADTALKSSETTAPDAQTHSQPQSESAPEIKDKSMRERRHRRIISQRMDLHFSSSPGFLSSVDDFFIVNGFGNLAVTETSEEIYNASLLSLVHPEAMLS